MRAYVFLFFLSAAQSSLQLSSASESNKYTSNSDENKCPPWQSNVTGTCTCIVPSSDGSKIVRCENDPYSLSIQKCFCMTYIDAAAYVGPCMYTCKGDLSYYYVNLSTSVCDEYKRQGQLCGSCEDGYAPSIYSYYSLSCVKCTTSNWRKYMAVSYIPLTIFFVFVVTFRVNVNNPMLYGPVLLIQFFFSSSLLQFVQNRHYKYVGGAKTDLITWKVLSSIFGMWNLDFLRIVYSPFCLIPNTNNLSVLALDYLTAIYPLFLIGITYLLVLLYDSNVRVIVCLFKPMIPFFIRFRRQWNIKSSLVDAFATFLLLSYVKILNISVNTLLPVVLYDEKFNTFSKLYVFNQGDEVYFGRNHFPYACLALFFLLLFILLPMILLLVYPCSCFQVCLNQTGRNCQTLHIFMDSFQGHYKNGKNGTHDFRYFSGLYLLLRILVSASLFSAYVSRSYTNTTAIIAFFVFLTMLAYPFRKRLSNISMSFSLFLLLLYSVYFLPYYGISSYYTIGHFNTPLHVVVAIVSVVFVVVSFLCVCIPEKKLSDIRYSSAYGYVKNTMMECFKTRMPTIRDGYQSLQEY